MGCFPLGPALLRSPEVVAALRASTERAVLICSICETRHVARRVNGNQMGSRLFGSLTWHAPRKFATAKPGRSRVGLEWGDWL